LKMGSGRNRRRVLSGDGLASVGFKPSDSVPELFRYLQEVQ